jgi:putative membrane-bound dehydrogenase-like protein
MQQRVLTWLCLGLLAGGLALRSAPTQAWQIPEGVKSTQKPVDKPLSPEEALARIKLPEGFKATLFAAEPHVAQPIAFAFDDRGRLWVAECYSYGQWDRQGKTGHDRVVIFEDKDNDGKFDERRVFAENLANLSGIEIGFGGVWICSAPNLYFIPDTDGDDKPDGAAVSKIDGWIVGNVGHNIFNGLTWGPEGWLYGLHGIQDESKLAKPGTPDEERTKMRCGVWRYHPIKERIEVVCHGTTNPWGLDFNDMGEGFFTNCVIGHLWQAIPGAHFKRMYGEDYNRHAYELIDQHADHLHWAGDKWTAARGGEAHDKLGGGHAHVGAMIYQADNWPGKYRQMIGMCNVHGQRLNFDKLEREGSGYVGRRGEDLFFANDSWFRGITVKYGPDGGVYISDWCDLGECHDNDGVHRASGRIYKVVFERKSNPDASVSAVTNAPPENQPKQYPTTSKDLAAKPFDIAKLDNAELTRLQMVPNAWWARRAALELQRRAARGDDMSDVHRRLTSLFEGALLPQKLRAMWALHVTGGWDQGALVEQLHHENEYIRRWSVQLLVEDTTADTPAAKEVVEKFTALAKDDPSPLVRLALASAMQRLPLEQRWSIATNLVSHEADNDDHNLPLMIWYGIEPAVASDKAQALKLASSSKLSKVRQFIAKRVAEASK